MLDLSGVRSLLISGTNGFVGRSIVDQIAALETQNLPNQILFITRNGLNFELPSNMKDISIVSKRDLTKEWEINKSVSHIINLAADGSRSPYSAEANNTFSLIVNNLIKSISALPEPPHLFHASSGACAGYNPIKSENISEIPKSSFRQNRLQAEYDLIRASNNFDFKLSIGRLFTFAGSHILNKNQYAISNFIKSGLVTNKIHITGDPKTVRSYLHQEDMAKWILTSLTSEAPHSDLQIGSSRAVTMEELAQFIADNTSAEISLEVNPSPGDIYLPNNEATRVKLGVSEGKNWEFSVLEMIEMARRTIHGAK